MFLLQISSAQGPIECCQAVALAYRRIYHEALKKQVAVDVIEQVDGPASGTYRSIVLSLEGDNALALAQRWCGSVQWICSSSFRPRHKRKNWFIGVNMFNASEPLPLVFNSNEVVFDTMRSSGPGGQHVNTTESAIRATHKPTGISVKIQTQRSQHANKQLAMFLLAQKLQEQEAAKQQQQRSEQRLKHYQIERGNPVLIFKGEDFCPN